MGRLSDWDAAEVAKRLSKPGIGRSRPSSGGWLAPCPAHDDRKPSLSLGNGADGRLLWNCFGGCSSEEVRKALSAVLGGEEAPERGEEDRQREKVEDPRRPVVPVPAAVAATIDDFTHVIHGAPSRVWTYKLHDGAIAGWVARYDVGEGDKEVVPFIWTRHDVTGHEEMRMKGFPEPRPLYNLDQIATRPEATVVVNEGEKAADAASRLFPDWVATAIPGGGNAVRFADLSALAHRTVVLFADHDGPGYEFALRMLERMPASTDVRMLAWPKAWPESRGGGPYVVEKGWDAHDHVENGWNRDLLREVVGETGWTLVHRIHHLPQPFQMIHYVDTKPS